MDVLSTFHPVVREWFTGRFGTPTEPQLRGWPAIASGRDTLVAAPTGSGKTLAAFLWCIDELVREGLAGDLKDEVRVLYVSPLKALGNDVEKNLTGPLTELRALAEAHGTPLPAIRTAVRSGDTLQKDRAKALRTPPHVLLTTPESLYVLLGSDGGRRMLSTVRTVIVDEIHAVAGDKRGQHLALSLARLDRLLGRRAQRVGLSATQRPIEEIARLLVGTERARGPRPDCAIVDEGHVRKLDVAVEVPGDELSSVLANEGWAQIFDRIVELSREHRTTLVFVDTRRMAERAARALAERLGAEKVAAHHGSLSRAIRLRAEQRLKSGEVAVCVATASLELGIDVGDVDLVCMIGAPRAFAVGLQRIGRAGHGRGRVPKGRLFPTSRDDLVECAAFLRGVKRGRLEATCIPANARDVLAQQIVAEAAVEPLSEDELYTLVRSAWPYATLAREELDAILAMLSEGVATRRGRAGALLHRNGVEKVVKGRRGARLAALTSGGAIPDNTQYAVVADPDETVVGAVDEDFAIDSMAGDVFSLGNASWRIRRIEAGKLRVEDAGGQPPSIPFWFGEAPGRSRELSAEVSALRADIEPLLADVARAERFAIDECGLDLPGAKQLVAYLAASASALGALPTHDTLVAERFFDESGGMQLVVHAPFGMGVNRAFGMALRKRFCRSFDFELQAAANDDGVLLSLGPQHSFPLESIFELVRPHEVEEVLVQAALQAPMFGVRWRWNATRSLAVLRFSGGRKTPPPLVRMRSEDLLSAVFPAQVACQDNAPGGPIEVPDHPLVKETVEDCLQDAMDAAGFAAVLERIAAGEVQLIARDLPEPSPLCHELLSGKPYTFLDDAPLEERRARAVVLRRSLPAKEAAAFGALDPEAIATVVAQVWPDPRDLDELHDVLLTLVALPDSEAGAWREGLRQLAEGRRASLRGAGVLAGPHWLAPERAERLAGDDGAYEVVRGWMSVVGPVTAEALAARLGMTKLDVDVALARLEMEGSVLQGTFTGQASEWCDRSLLARIHRLTLGRLRREIAPVPPSDLLRFLARWQRVQPGTQAHGPAGLVEVIAQLQGLQLPASAWESEILPARVAGYEPGWLDELCHSGTVGWGRLVPGTIEPDTKRRAPTRNAPVGLFVRDDLPWLLPPVDDAYAPSPNARAVLDLLERRGASFFGELVQAARKPAPEVEEALWELVAAGRIASDGFAGLRALIGSERGLAARAGGRWWLLRRSGEEASPLAGEDSGPTEAHVTTLLRRWGVLFRDVLLREAWAPPWRDLLPVLRRREARGELRGGRFVSGFTGEQFALPEAVEGLRQVRRTEASGAERLDLSAADPLNVVGLLTPGPRVPAVSGGRVVLVDGVPQREQVA